MPPPFDLLPPLLSGLWVTLEVFGGGAVIAIVVAFGAGIAKLNRRRWLRWPAVGFIEIFRGTSALVQLFWFFFVLPLLGINLAPLAAGILVLGLNGGAYGAEVVRGAIQAVPKGQYEASTALNLTSAQTLWRVIVPQAVIAMLPPFNNILIELLKNTALVSLVTITELTFAGQTLRGDTGRTAEIFGLILLIYYLMAMVVTLIFRFAERRLYANLGLGGSAQ